MSEEVLSEHTREVQSLVQGDMVVVQNQTCPKTNKRDLSWVDDKDLGNNSTVSR